MSDNIYEAPASHLEKEQKSLSAAERLDQSRRDMEEAAAVSKLNMIWGVRLVVDLLIISVTIVSAFFMRGVPGAKEMFSVAFVGLFFGGEIVFIVGYFKRKKWCVIPLHIYAAISLFNIPFGSILSIIHFFNLHKVQFDKNV